MLARFDRTLRRLWISRKQAAFPPGATTWHLVAWRQARLTHHQCEEAAQLLRRLAIDTLWILHGGAIARGTDVSLLTGPAGAGKSSAMLGLERDGGAEILEDGLLLLGRCGDRWLLLRTGTLAFMRANGALSRLLRRLASPAAACSRWCLRRAGSSNPPPWGPPWMTDFLARAAFSLTVLVHRPGRARHFADAPVPVARVVWIAQRGDPLAPLRLEADGRLTGDPGLFAELARQLRVEAISASGDRRETRARLQAALAP